MNGENCMAEGIMKKKKIAVFANGWSSEYLELVLEGLRRAAQKDNVDIFVFSTYISWGETDIQSKCQLNIFHLPKPEDYDGAIVLANTFNMPDELQRVCALFKNKGIPLVSTEVKVPGMAFVGTDNYAGMHELAEHLVQQHNARRFVYVSGIEGNEECAIRRKALMDVIEKYDCELVDEYAGNFGFYRAYTDTREWIDNGNVLPDAFVCANDHMALGVVNAVFDSGYSIPQDTLVTGFDLIHEARVSYPIMATVSRRWDRMGEMAYEELKEQIRNEDPNREIIYDTRFIPSESCGCEPDRRALNKRLERSRHLYQDNAVNDIFYLSLQGIRIAMSKVDTREKFNEVASEQFSRTNLAGDNFCICVEPMFFDTEDEVYPERIRGYSEIMDVVYEKKDGKSQKYRQFNSRQLYPGYEKSENSSNMYLFVPMYSYEYVIGYVAIKNQFDIYYNLDMRKWIADMNAMLISIRQYIFAQKTNAKLKQIYMTDSLTGLFNRTGVDSQMFDYVETEKAAGRSTILMFADIDCMKLINDEYGHLNGDLAIKATADALKASLPKEWKIGRYGGDEFVAVGPCGDETEAENLKNETVESIRKIISNLKIAFKLTVSVGYTVIRPEDDRTVADFIRIADGDMYEEKKKAHRERGLE